MAKNDFINTIIIVFLFLGLVGAIANIVTSQGSELTKTEDLVTLSTTVPQNFTITGETNAAFVSINNVSNGSTLLPVTTNYTLIQNTNDNTWTVQLLDNTSWTGTATVNYQYQRVKGVSGVLLVLTTLLLIIIFVVSLGKTKTRN